MPVDTNALKRLRVGTVEAAKYVMQISLSASQRLAAQVPPPPYLGIRHRSAAHVSLPTRSQHRTSTIVVPPICCVAVPDID